MHSPEMQRNDLWSFLQKQILTPPLHTPWIPAPCPPTTWKLHIQEWSLAPGLRTGTADPDPTTQASTAPVHIRTHVEHRATIQATNLYALHKLKYYPCRAQGTIQATNPSPLHLHKYNPCRAQGTIQATNTSALHIHKYNSCRSQLTIQATNPSALHIHKYNPCRAQGYNTGQQSFHYSHT